MAQMISIGKELIRINPQHPHKIEASINQGRNWMSRNVSLSFGNFLDLMDNGNEILGTTTKGVYTSKNGGRNWMKRS